MLSDFLARIRHEASISLTAVRESLISVAERVNRKVQIVKLHAYCSSIEDQLTAQYVNLGATLAEHLPLEPPIHRSLLLPPDASLVAPRLASTLTQVQRLRRELHRLSLAIAEIETDTLTDTLLRMHHDLSVRGAAVERWTVQPGSLAASLTARDFEGSSQTRLIAVCRGPALLTTFDHLTLAPGDIVLLIGLRSHLRTAAHLTEAPHGGTV